LSILLTERDNPLFCEPSILVKSDLIHSKSLISLFPVMWIVEEIAGNSIPANCGEDMEEKKKNVRLNKRREYLVML